MEQVPRSCRWRFETSKSQQRLPSVCSAVRAERLPTMTRLLFLCCFLKYAIGLPIADTVYGPVYGQYRRALGTVYEAYFGLPYALPPTGPRRLTLPQYYNTIFEPKEQDARVPPMMCPQGPLGDQILLEGQSEDCLYLNVFRMNGTIRTDMKSVSHLSLRFSMGDTLLNMSDASIKWRTSRLSENLSDYTFRDQPGNTVRRHCFD